MKKTKILGLLMPLFAMTLAGCGTSTPEYKHDKTNHWLEDAEGLRDDSTMAKHTFEEVADESTAATCKADGKKVSKCTVCGYKKEEKVTKLSHTYVVDPSSTTSTCKVAGKKVEKCSACGDTKETTLALADHTMVEDPTKTIIARCNAEGEVTKVCSVCGHTETTKTPKTAHTFVGSGTLKDGGYYEYECSVCSGKVESRVKISDAVMVQGTLGSSGSEKGKFSSSNNGGTTGIGSWTFQLPAGEYDVYFDMKYSTSGEGKTLSERGVKVTLNGADVTFDNTVSDDVIGTSTSEFKSITFCSITATGGVDVITLQNPYYRYVFDYDNGYVTFKPKVTIA